MIEKIFSRSSDLLSTDMDGETVMMSISRGQYYGVGGVGPRIWELLTRPMSVADIVQAICAEYAVDRDSCEADVRTFLGNLLAHGLVTEG
jgi:hypothetical protein